MPNALGSFLHALPFGPLHSIRRFTANPVVTQERLLRSLLRRAAGTEWGRRYGFGELADAPDVVAAYQERVPLHDYDDLREDADRIRAGAADVTWPGCFRHFAVSSGTASDGKVIPVSHEMLVTNRNFSIGTGLNYLAVSGRPGFLFGKQLSLPGRIEEDPQYPGTLVGEVSGLLAEYAPAWLQYAFQAVGPETWYMPNWERKLERVVEQTVDQDVRMLVMAPTWALTLFRKLIAHHNQKYSACASTVGEVWPNLQLFISGGVALSSYRDLIEERVGLSNLDFVETYGASEGFISFQNDLADPAMLLHLDNGVFFEFVRMDELHEPDPRRFTVADVEQEVLYALYVTTFSGLWSYAIGDVVRFTDTSPHKILVAGRTSEMIDKYGEAVFGEEMRAALDQACGATDALVRDYHVAPVTGPDSVPRHQWLIEFERPPAELDVFARVIDRHLQEVNRHYQIRREADAFGRPQVVPLPRDTFYRWLQETRDHVSGQTKVPRMSEERGVADGVLALSGNKA